MKKTFTLPKSKLYGEIDYSAVLSFADNRTRGLSKVPLGQIILHSGKVCFFDPYAKYKAESFPYELPRHGGAEVYAIIRESGDGAVIAFAVIDCGTLSSSREFRLMYRSERDLLAVLHGGKVGATVESGLCAVCDEREYGEYIKLVEEAGDEFHPLDGCIYLDDCFCEICALKEVRLPVFGVCAGEYNAYIGIDGNGEATGIICDFGVVKSPVAARFDEKEQFTVEMSAADLYAHDLAIGENRNNIERYTNVIAEGGDAATLFNAYSRRGYAYHVDGQKDKALADYLSAISIGQANREQTGFDNNSWSLYDNAASIYEAAGRTEEQIALYEQAISSPDSFDNSPYIGLINIYRNNKDYAKALAIADKMVAARPQDPSAYMVRSEVCMACEEYERAIADIDVLVYKYKLSESILDKAMCQSILGRNKEALETVDTYLLEGLPNETYYDIRSGIHSALGEFSAAYHDALKAYEYNPDYSVVLGRLIDFDWRMLNFKNVVKWASRLIDINPESEYGYSVRAEAYERMGAYREAAEDYIYILRNIKDDSRYYGLLVKCALKSGPISAVKKSLKVLRKRGDAYYFYAQGLVLKHDSRLARAESYFNTAFTMQEDEAILSALIDIYIETGRLDKAEAAIPAYAEIAEGENVFLVQSRIALIRGLDAEKIKKDYVKRFMCACKDQTLLRSADVFFRNLADK